MLYGLGIALLLAVGAGAAAASTAPLVQMSDVECGILNSLYGPEIFLPNETEYSILRVENWSGTAVKTPTCIFRPKSVYELGAVVKQLQKNNIHFAIRSGGHLPSPGAANIDNGVLIDLSGFNEVTYNRTQNSAVIGSGLRWQDVYERLDASNVTVVGARVLDVGVGGFLLGGGLSYVSDIYGLACDNVINYEVVLGNGSAVNASRNQNAELFWSLKGGSNNFGIVTRFTVSTYPNSEVWGGVKAYSLDKLPALFDAMYAYQTVANKDPKANLMLQGYISNETIGIVLNMIYLAPEISPPAFAPFYQINTTSDTTRILSLTSFLEGQGPIDFPPRIDWRATSFLPDKALYSSLTDLMINSEGLARIKGVQSGTVAFGLQPISTSVIQAGLARGGNALGLENRNQTWFVIDSGWLDPSDDHTVHNATASIVDLIRAAANKAAAGIPYIFMNDASYDQNVIAGYGVLSVARLKAAAAVFDPWKVFQKLVPGGFKLG